MSQVISTVLFNGQFWIALIEKHEENGTLLIGKHTFGPEPANADLIDFYQNKYQNVRFFQSEERLRIKKKYSKKESDRNCRKSYEIFKTEQKKFLAGKKKDYRKKKKETEREEYLKKVKKKKCKKRSH